MIDDSEIIKKAEEFKLSPHDLQRDYVHGLLLFGISSRPYLLENMVLKGGNALRKAYIPSTRFSKDLDFSLKGQAVIDLLEEELLEACNVASKVSGVKFDEKTVVRRKKFNIESISALEVRLYFETFYGTEQTNLKVQLDLTESDKIILPVQHTDIINPYSDSQDYKTTFPVQKIEEILASKLNALLYRPRRKCADLFDVTYATLLQKDYPVSAGEVISTFLRKSVFRRHAAAAREELISLPIEEFRTDWTSVILPSSIKIDFEKMSAEYPVLIDDLCSTVDMPTTTSTDLFLSSADRNKIMKAITDTKLINMRYEECDREIEPYEVQYYVRKSDGVGSEYFWGYDRTGGRSGTIGIKQFFTSKIEGFSIIDTIFEPRFINGVPV